MLIPNKRSFLTAIAFFCSLSLSGCASGITQIRIQNNSEVDFESVVVEFPSQREDYGPIKQGAASNYREVETAYQYAYVEVVADGEQFVIQPIDYVGESPLGSGNFTYVLDINKGILLLDLVKE